jgi:hypothetical protein
MQVGNRIRAYNLILYARLHTTISRPGQAAEVECGCIGVNM